jgi:hypothetical protein
MAEEKENEVEDNASFRRRIVFGFNTIFATIFAGVIYDFIARPGITKTGRFILSVATLWSEKRQGYAKHSF